MAEYFVSGGLPVKGVNPIIYQTKYEPVAANASIAKPTINFFDPQIILKVGQTLGAVFTGAFIPMAAGNMGFQYGVKTGQDVAQAAGQTINQTIQQTKNAVAKTLTGLSYNVVGVFVIIVLIMLIMRRVLS